MPTECTAKLMEEGQTFREFVLHCAYTMAGPTIVREFTRSGGGPETLKPDPHHANEVEKAAERVTQLLTMTEEQREAYGAEQKAALIRNLAASRAQDSVQNARLEDMRHQVEEWVPSTPDQVNLKQFMLKHIRLSEIDMRPYHVLTVHLQERSNMSFFTSTLNQAKKDMEYHQVEAAKESERIADVVRWTAQLWESLQH